MRLSEYSNQIGYANSVKHGNFQIQWFLHRKGWRVLENRVSVRPECALYSTINNLISFVNLLNALGNIFGSCNRPWRRGTLTRAFFPCFFSDLYRRCSRSVACSTHAAQISEFVQPTYVLPSCLFPDCTCWHLFWNSKPRRFQDQNYFWLVHNVDVRDCL